MPGGKRDGWFFLLDAVLLSYASIFFSRSRRIGAVLLAATLLAPGFGLVGLAGVIIAFLVAWELGFDRANLRSGASLFNSLLVALALAYLNNSAPTPLDTPVFILLLISGSALALFMQEFLAHTFYLQYGLPALSMPFVIVAFFHFFLFFSLTATPITSGPLTYLLPQIPLPSMHLTAFFQSFGAIFFMPHTTVGLLIFLAMLGTSRLAMLYIVVGYVAGVLFLSGCQVDIVPANMEFIGFNFIFCAMALGGIYFIPSRGSLLLVVLGSFFCVTIALSVRSFLRYFGIPPLALPFNLVVMLMVYTMKLRTEPRRIFSTPFPPQSPEENFHKYTIERRRFPDAPHVQILPPFFGERMVTQGFDGGLTHKGEWRYALDFEVLDENGGRFHETGDQLKHYHTFNTPVLAPGAGSVVRVINEVRDNPIGEDNLVDNWGNLVILLLDNGCYATLSHFRQNSIEVAPAQRVSAGQRLGFCGNSGRSPVPHLHFQVQTSPLAGATGIPFRLAHYLELTPGSKTYRFTGLPKEKTRIKAVVFNDRLGDIFAAMLNGPVFYRWRRGRTDVEERIDTWINAAGCYVFSSRETGCWFSAWMADHTFCTADYQLDSRSVLCYFWLALSRLPFIGEDGVVWRDCLDSRPLLDPAGRLWVDLTGPFLRYPLLQMETRLDLHPKLENGQRNALQVSTRVLFPTVARHAVGATWQVDLVLTRGQGIAGGTVRRQDEEISIEVAGFSESQRAGAGRR